MLHYPYYIPSPCPSLAIYMVVILVRMGRKLKLSVHRKNEERRKRAAKAGNYTVKIPLCALDLPAPATSEGLSFLVSLPLRMFMEGSVECVQALSHRLQKADLLPNGLYIQ